MDVTCPKCGAENYDSARYCRKCGEQIGDSDFHEARTRELSQERGAASAPEPRRYETFPSAPLNQSAPSGSPRYVPPPAHPVPFSSPGVTGMPARVDTSPINTGPVAKKTNWLLIIGGILMAFILGIGVIVAIVANVAKEAIKEASRSGPIADKQNGPPGSGFPSGKVIKNPKLEQLPAEVRPLYYTGATMRELVSGGAWGISGSVLTMDTDDEADTVAEYYRDKFDGKGTEVDEGDEWTFTNEQGTVVRIEANAGEDGNTAIEVIMGRVPGMPAPPPGAPDVPNPQGIPAPPAPPTLPAPSPPPGTPAPATPKPTK